MGRMFSSTPILQACYIPRVVWYFAKYSLTSQYKGFERWQTSLLPLNVLGTPSCLQAMYKHAEAMASLLLPFKLFCS